MHASAIHVRIGLHAVLLATLCAGPARADPAAPPPHDRAQKLIEDTTQRILSAVVENREEIREDRQRLYDLVDEIVLPHFDFSRMSMRVLGKHWRSASVEQRGRFVSQFQILLVRTYATALEEYTGQTIHVQPVRSRPEARQVSVRMELQPHGGAPIPINYALYRRGESWKIYDVAVDGVSLVINYRSSFGAEIRKNGLDGLIEKLVQRNRWDDKTHGNRWDAKG